MIALESDSETFKDFGANVVPMSFHRSFYPVYDKLKRWVTRFPFSFDNSIFKDLSLVYLLASKQYLDHRTAGHLFRLITSIHHMQKKLIRASAFSPDQRHLEIRWIPTNLFFPFSSRSALGCLIGFNLIDRYEVFDEENILLALQKYLPQLRLVKESSYPHTSQYKNLKLFYFEIEKKDGSNFSLLEQTLLRDNLEEKVSHSIQKLSPNIFMPLNEEEIYKNIFVLSQEIQTLQDPPQAYIALDQQTGNEIVFRITLVHISPFHRFSLKERFFNSSFTSQRIQTVKHLGKHPIEAHIFTISIERDPTLLRSDGSLNFHLARKRIVELIKSAIGDFRDYNGGIIIKQQEILEEFKAFFPKITETDPELIEKFFYEITPLEKQITLGKEILTSLFSYFLENKEEKLQESTSYSFRTNQNEKHLFVHIHGKDASLKETLSNILNEYTFKMKEMAYNILDTSEGIFLNCVLLENNSKATDNFIQGLREFLSNWSTQKKEKQCLRIGLEYSVVSLDPRIGGDVISGEVLRLLFEGLTRFSPKGNIENAVAESIEISPDKRHYTFKLRNSLWNDGTPVSAYDFEYAWKKILSIDFKTPFAYFFHPIKNAKKAKEGKATADTIGIYALDDRTLKVELERPTPYFLQLTAHPLYAPVNRTIDQQQPQWPYQSDINYPCNGAFQLKINQTNQSYQLIKNSFYWDNNSILLDEITLSQMSATQIYYAFQKDEIDWIGNPFGGCYPAYIPEHKDRVISFPNSMVCWSVFNTRYLPFQNLKIRQAFAYAIERTKIISDAFLPLNPAHSPLIPYYRESQDSLFPDFNFEKANRLLNEGLKELGIEKKDLAPLTISFHEKGINEHTALCLKKQFEENLGIPCELKALSWASLFKKMTGGDFQMGLMYWMSMIDDPIYTLNEFKSASEEINFPKWENSEFQRLLDLSEFEINPYQRSAYLLKAEEILCQEMPIIPLFYQPYQILVKKKLNITLPNVPCRPFEIARSYWKESI
jgi:oligopeptide transport system substrate-binding protein